jgi:cytosine/adenosine deaminase-related metal-dependent hydrolase
MMTTVIRNATLLATMDAQRREIADGALVIEGNQIAWVGATADLAPDLLDGAATVIDARGRSCCRALSTPITTSTRR